MSNKDSTRLALSQSSVQLIVDALFAAGEDFRAAMRRHADNQELADEYKGKALRVDSLAIYIRDQANKAGA